jgi:predicted nucleic acid-binding protein
VEAGQISHLNRLLLDTSVLIAVLRGNRQIARGLNELVANFRLGISVITWIEIYVGVISARHENETSQLLSNFEIVAVDEKVAMNAVFFIKKYPSVFGKAASRGTADALIAACAKTIGAKLVSLNSRHFDKISKEDLFVEVLRA